MPTQFEKLSFAPGRRFAWCCGPDGLEGWLGKAHEAIICGVGKDEGWLRERLGGGTFFRLVIWSDVQGTRELADWRGIFRLIRREYGPRLHNKLSEWGSALESTPFDACVAPDWPAGVGVGAGINVGAGVDMKKDVQAQRAAAKRPGHPLHMSVDRYLALPDVS